MKIVFVIDLHGCKWKYDRLFKIAQGVQAKVVSNGGDMLPKKGSSASNSTTPS